MTGTGDRRDTRSTAPQQGDIPQCGRTLALWDGEYEGDCLFDANHVGDHFDGSMWFDDEGGFGDTPVGGSPMSDAVALVAAWGRSMEWAMDVQSYWTRTHPDRRQRTWARSTHDDRLAIRAAHHLLAHHTFPASRKETDS